VRDDPDEGYKNFGPTKISANRKRGDPPLFSKTQRTNDYASVTRCTLTGRLGHDAG
jgi:hypothetical protein